METIPKKKNHKRKAEEINSDSGTVAEEDNEISKADDSGPLGLCDDIVLGEVITQFPWYNLRVVAGLSAWWAHAMEHSFPYYARLRNPRVLSNSLVLFHTPNPRNDAYDNTLSLWVYSDDEGAVFNLSVPDIPEGLRSDVKFVTDLNDDRIYSFIPVDENGREMYDVRVVDLREGNLWWKKLMPLPVLEEQFVSSCSSIDNGGSSTTYHILWVPSGFDDLDEEDISVWMLTGRNGVIEWQTQWELELAPSPDLIDKLIGSDSEKVRPIYLEIDIPADSGHNARKCLYKMCEHSEYSTQYSSLLDLPHFLLLRFQDSEDVRRTEQRTTVVLQNKYIQNQLKYASSAKYVVKCVLGNQAQSEGDIDEVCELVNGVELVLGEEDSFNAYLLKAVKNNNGAAVLLLSDVFGFEDSETRDFAYRLSCNGYNVLVPDLYRGKPWSKDRPQSEFEEWRRKHLPHRVASDIDTSAKWLLDEFIAAGISDKLGIVGFCFGGGRLVETLARDKQSHFGAAVSFYGTRLDPSLAAQLKIPVLFIVGENDPLCPVDLLRQMESQLKGSQVCVYAGRGHGFAHRPESLEEDQDAEAAFNTMRNWLNKYLVQTRNVKD